MLVGASATGNWPGPCDSHEGVQLTVLFAAFFACFTAGAAIDTALFFAGLRGAPFEESKRRWVVPLLYLGTVPLVIQLAFTLYGTWAVVSLEPDCWAPPARDAITNFAQALVFTNWAFCFFAFLGAAVFYNIYPEVQERETWEARCACIATLLCCRQQVERRPEGRRPPLKNIAELTAGLLSHVDLNATDIAAAVVLTSAAQQRRRRLRIAKALLPVYRALREPQERWGAQGGGGGSGSGAMQAWSMPAEFEAPSAFEGAGWQEEESDDQDEAAGSEGPWLPSDPELTRTLTMARAASAAAPPSSPAFVAAGMQPYMSVPAPSSVSARGTPPPVQATMERTSGSGTGFSQSVEALEKARSVAALSPGGDAGMTEAAAEVAADEVASGAAAPTQAVDQLAAAIQEEVEQLGEGPLDEAVLSIRQVRQEGAEAGSVPSELCRLTVPFIFVSPRSKIRWTSPPSIWAPTRRGSGSSRGLRRRPPATPPAPLPPTPLSPDPLPRRPRPPMPPTACSCSTRSRCSSPR